MHEIANGNIAILQIIIHNNCKYANGMEIKFGESEKILGSYLICAWCEKGNIWYHLVRIFMESIEYIYCSSFFCKMFQYVAN